jgi:hypothetical protein
VTGTARQHQDGDHSMASLKPETRAKLETVSTATLCTALYKKGLRKAPRYFTWVV